MERTDFSAGFLVFAGRRESLKFLLLRARTHDRYWGFPKGHPKEGETPFAAALRELLEETGISQANVITGFSRSISYRFRSRDGGTVRKTVEFFLAESLGEKVSLSSEHSEYSWLSPEDSLAKLTFDTEKSVLLSAIERLREDGAL